MGEPSRRPDLRGPAMVRSYPQFLERLKQTSAQVVVNDVRVFVSQFPANLTRPQAARRIHSFISDAVPNLLKTQAFSDDTSEEAHEQAVEGLEKFVIFKLYKLLFRHAPADVREDEHIENCIRNAIHGSFVSVFSEESSNDFDAAILELQKVEQYRAPRDKLVCLLNAYRIIEGIVDEAFRTNGAGGRAPAPQLRHLLAELVIRASPPNLFSNVEFTRAYRHPTRITAEERRCLEDLSQTLVAVTDERQQRQRRADAEASSDSEDPDDDLARVPAKSQLPPWLVDAGITFHFEDRSAEELLLGEADELLDEYHRMVRALRDLSGVQAGKSDDKPSQPG